MRRALLISLLPCLLACGSSTEGVDPGASCPDDSQVTYEGFVAGFMDDYCTRCHSSELSPSERQGAPSGHDFDTLEGVLMYPEHIAERAAGGPDGVNRSMPPSGREPSDEERRMLGEWLACVVEGQVNRDEK